MVLKIVLEERRNRSLDPAETTRAMSLCVSRNSNTDLVLFPVTFANIKINGHLQYREWNKERNNDTHSQPRLDVEVPLLSVNQSEALKATEIEKMLNCKFIYFKTALKIFTKFSPPMRNSKFNK